MSIQLFGQYLIERGVISEPDLARVLKFQGKNNLSIAGLVTRMDLMIAAQVELVLAAQQRKPLPFEELALQMGYLNRSQVKLVLKVQQKKHIHIGQALVALGVLDKAELDRQLEKFKQQLDQGAIDLAG